MGQHDRKTLFSGMMDRHFHAASNGTDVIANRQQTICLIYHRRITPSAMHRRSTFLTCDYGFQAALDAQGTVPAALDILQRARQLSAKSLYTQVALSTIVGQSEPGVRLAQNGWKPHS